MRRVPTVSHLPFLSMNETQLGAFTFSVGSNGQMKEFGGAGDDLA